MLLDSFYYILNVRSEESAHEIRIEFNEKHKIFDGHFPEFPVVPGVCQVQILKETLSKILNRDLQISIASSIKFLNVIEPLKTKELNMKVSLANLDSNRFLVDAVYENEGNIFFRFKGELSAE